MRPGGIVLGCLAAPTALASEEGGLILETTIIFSYPLACLQES